MKSPRPTRRQFLTTTTQSVAAIAALSSTGCKRPATPAKPRNVILVTMDTTGARHLGCYGYQRTTTPNLDAFAQQSILFEDAYASSSCTFPNHCSIFTGQYPHNHGTIDQVPLRAGAVTIAALLQDQGYRTAAITSVSFLNERTMGIGIGRFFSPNDGLERRADETLAIARDQLQALQSQKQPFFLWIHLWDPHHPYAPPAEFSARFLKNTNALKRIERDFPGMFRLLDPGAREKTRCFLDDEEQQALISQYDGEVQYMDEQVGAFNTFLKEKNALDNTMVIYTADHGEALCENSRALYQHRYIYEPVVRIPLIIRHPDLAPRRVSGLVQNIDITPTILAGLRIPSPPLDGADLLFSPPAQAPTRDRVYLTGEGARVFGITTRDGAKARCCLLPRSGPRATPEDWTAQQSTLPQIHLTSAQTDTVFYQSLGGQLPDIHWRCLDNEEGIVRYALESVTAEGNVFRTPARHISVAHGIGTCTFYKAAPRNWAARVHNGAMTMRVVGLDASEEPIAASTTIHRHLTSPLPDDEIYDLAADPNETVNLAQDNPDMMANLRSELTEFARHSRALVDTGGNEMVPEKPQTDERDREALEAMGYL